MNPIKVGIVGAGFIGPAHVEALRRLGRVEVVALAASTPASAEAKARALAVPRAYGRYEELVADPEVQVVHNCAPNHLHLPLNLAALSAGKHIVSEKPLGLNSEETRRMVRAAEESGRVHAVVFNYRMYPLVQQARAMIRAAELGEVRLVHGAYLQDWLLYDTDFNWRIEPELGGPSRVVADIGSHWCDLAMFVSGLDIVEVCADFATFIPVRRKPKRAVATFTGAALRPEDYEPVPITSEDYASVLLRFANGARGSFLVSQVSAGRKNGLWLEVDGSESALAWRQEEPNELWIGHRDRPNQLLAKDPALLRPEAQPYAHYPGGHGEAYPDGLRNLFQNVYRFIAEGGDPRTDPVDFPTFHDGDRSVRVVEAIVNSARERRWVQVT